MVTTVWPLVLPLRMLRGDTPNFAATKEARPSEQAEASPRAAYGDIKMPVINNLGARAW
jgi:hypothetical protein